jgi:uridine kinase
MLTPTKPFLVGIAGPSGAGKTTLARALATQFSSEIFPTDNYYRDLSHLPLEERARQNFDHPDALEHKLLTAHVAQLAEGGSIAHPIYDYSIHTRTGHKETLHPAEILIVDGLFTLHYPALRDLLDLKIYVEAADSLCLKRRIKRDVRERGRTPESVRQQYAETVHPMAEAFILPSRQYADIVLNGTVPIAESVESIVQIIRKATADRG